MESSVTPVGIERLRGHYRSGRDDLSRDFFQPCMRSAVRYRRSVGYFSTSSLLSWIDALPRVAMEDGLTIQLIASPELSPGDYQTLRHLGSEEQRQAFRDMVVERILETIASLAESPGDVRLRAQIFAWLIANDRLELRFAFPEHVEEAGIFHEKIGIFEFAGAIVAFTGSANETLSGHRRNYESIDVYRSWIDGEASRIAVKAEQFEEAWSGMAHGLAVLEPHGPVLDRLRARAPRIMPKGSADLPAVPVETPPTSMWRHQDEALETFIGAKAGILEMATGTGKTRTAIKILDRLIADRLIDAAIVTTDGTDLLDQWAAELDSWAVGKRPMWLVYKHFERHHQAGEFALSPKQSLIVISRGQLHRVLSRLPARVKERIIIIHDEIHGLGMPALVEQLAGSHQGFGYRLGLSATPDRAYDDKGNAFIATEVGETIFEFSLEDAIRRGVLSEFHYLPLPYELTDGDRERLAAVYSKKAARAREDKPMRDEELWTEIAKVYKTAEMKPAVFAENVAQHPEWLERAIIFVETKEYGAQILPIIDRYTHKYRTYYAEDDRAHLVSFAAGEIDCLITCHRISQGIDIRSLSTVVLFASARAKLETIQRIGRCLRTDPGRPDKRALVVDFVRPASPGDTVPNADQERSAWLSALAKTRRDKDHGA